MTERRPLVEGIKPKAPAERVIEQDFVFSGKPVRPPVPSNARVPLTTRIRGDIAQALKRASLERELQGLEPHTVQEMLEAALEPWLRNEGHLG